MPLRSFLLQGYWGTHRSSLGPNQRVHKTGWCSFVAAPFSQVWYLWAKFISDFWNNTAQAILLNENQNVASKLLCIAWPKVRTVQRVQHLVLLTDIEQNKETFQSTANRPLVDNKQVWTGRGRELGPWGQCPCGQADGRQTRLKTLPSSYFVGGR